MAVPGQPASDRAQQQIEAVSRPPSLALAPPSLALHSHCWPAFCVRVPSISQMCVTSLALARVNTIAEAAGRGEVGCGRGSAVTVVACAVGPFGQRGRVDECARECSDTNGRTGQKEGASEREFERGARYRANQRTWSNLLQRNRANRP